MKINRFWITEKPDMARNLAAGLALTHGAKVVNDKEVRHDGCMRTRWRERSCSTCRWCSPASERAHRDAGGAGAGHPLFR